MTVINQASAGDHIGEIKFKSMKKGLYIDESKLFRKRLTFINKETVESYEIVMEDSETTQKGGLAKGVIGAATFGVVGAVAGATSKKSKTQHRRIVSVIFKDGTKSLCELDDHFYEILVKLLY